jgi:predicted 3-demethylubiquinone-9 3-methyltransferase (glyoxalase superfamily)
MQKIMTCLWFDTQAEEAARFYTSIFNNSNILTVTHYSEVGPRPEGMVMTVTFQIDRQEFMALNGGPEFKFSEAISIVVNAETQAEIDRLWESLSDGGEIQMCGWLKDKYGVSWQIVPSMLDELLANANPEQGKRVTEAIFQMKKLDISALQAAYESA